LEFLAFNFVKKLLLNIATSMNDHAGGFILLLCKTIVNEKPHKKKQILSAL